MHSLHAAPFAAALLLSLLAGQDIAIANGNVSFQVNFNSTPVVAVSGGADFFRADPGGDPAGVLYKSAWAYRIDADTREYVFNDGGGQATYQNWGTKGAATWADVDARGKLRAVATYTAISTGANSGVVTCRLAIRNISAAPVTLNLFHMVDIDTCGAGALQNTVTPGNDGRQIVTGPCAETAQHYALGADRWEVGSYTNVPPGSGNVDLYAKMQDNNLDNLRNDAAPFGPYDIRGAFQWQDRVIPAGQTRVYMIALSHNTNAHEQDLWLTDANVSFGVEFNAAPFVAAQGAADFLGADPAGDPFGVLYKSAWAYRIDADAWETIFTDAAGQAVFASQGSVGTATWADVDARGQLAAIATYRAISTGASSGVVTCRMQLTNISAAPVTLNLFHMVDIDTCGAGALLNTVTPGNDGRQVVTGPCAETAEHFAGGADRWEVGSYTDVPPGSGNVDLYEKLQDNLLDNLRNDGSPFGPYDIRGAFQWQDRVLLPGQVEVFTIALAHNASSCAYAHNVFGNGMPGALGVPTLTASGDALLGQLLTLTIGNALPGTMGILALGFTRAATPFGDLTLYVGAPTVWFLPIGGSGQVSQNISIPFSMSYCGLPLVGQGAVFGDITSASLTGLPVTHSRGAIWVIGAY